MITEDYVSFEIAKLLKEKGFDADNVSEFGGYYVDFEHNGRNVGIATESMMLNKTLEDWECLRPTLQMTMKWLREVHSLAVILSPQWAEGDMRNPCKWLYEIIGLNDITNDAYNGALFDTYEEAAEAAIKYCLENII